MGLGEVRFRGLLLGGLADDSSAYHTFLKELSGHLRAFLRKRLVNLAEEVEDLAQELLLAVHDQRHTYDPGQPITAWIYTIARHKLIDLLRRRSHKELLNDPLDEEDGGGLGVFAALSGARSAVSRHLVRTGHTDPDSLRSLGRSAPIALVTTTDRPILSRSPQPDRCQGL